jgi:hypothetical protein
LRIGKSSFYGQRRGLDAQDEHEKENPNSHSHYSLRQRQWQ